MSDSAYTAMNWIHGFCKGAEGGKARTLRARIQRVTPELILAMRMPQQTGDEPFRDARYHSSDTRDARQHSAMRGNIPRYERCDATFREERAVVNPRTPDERRDDFLYSLSSSYPFLSFSQPTFTLFSSFTSTDLQLLASLYAASARPCGRFCAVTPEVTATILRDSPSHDMVPCRDATKFPCGWDTTKEPSMANTQLLQAPRQTFNSRMRQIGRSSRRFHLRFTPVHPYSHCQHASRILTYLRARQCTTMYATRSPSIDNVGPLRQCGSSPTDQPTKRSDQAI